MPKYLSWTCIPNATTTSLLGIICFAVFCDINKCSTLLQCIAANGLYNNKTVKGKMTQTQKKQILCFLLGLKQESLLPKDATYQKINS